MRRISYHSLIVSITMCAAGLMYIFYPTMMEVYALPFYREIGYVMILLAILYIISIVINSMILKRVTLILMMALWAVLVYSIARSSLDVRRGFAMILSVSYLFELIDEARQEDFGDAK